MTKIVYYSLAGGLAAVIALSLIKRKPSYQMATAQRALPGPRVYKSVAGDRPTAIPSRFGVPFGALMQANNNAVVAGQGKMLQLPPNVADLGARPQAMGTVQ